MDGSLSASEGIPCKAEAWLEVLGGGVRGDGTIGSDRTACGRAGGAVGESTDLLESPSGDRVAVHSISSNRICVLGTSRRFVPQTEVQRQALGDVPVVLEVCCEEAFAEGDLGRAAGRERVELVGCVGEELGQRAVVVETTVGAELLEYVIVHALERSSNLHGVIPFGNECIVIQLDGGPVMVEFVEPTQTIGSGQAGDGKLRRRNGTGRDRELCIRCDGGSGHRIVDESLDQTHSTAEGIDDG